MGFFLHKLGALLHGIPTRNMVVIGADWNTHCHPLAGHVGRGVMRTSHVTRCGPRNFSARARFGLF